MAVMLKCPACGSTTKLGKRKCQKCAHDLTKSRKYKIALKLPSGKWRTKTVGKLDTARTLEAKWIDEIKINGDVKDAPSMKLAAVWKAFNERVNQRLKHPDAYEGHWRIHVGPALGEKPLKAITPGILEDFMGAMYRKRVKASHNAKEGNIKPLSPRSIHYSMALIRRLFNYASTQGIWDGPNPAKRIDMPSYDNAVENILTKDQLGLLIMALDKWPNRMAALAFKFILATGKRAGEVFQLEWRNIDLHSQVAIFQIKSRKIGKTQRLPLSGLSCEILLDAMQYKMDDSQLVFHTETGKRIHYYPAWLRILKSAGLPSTFRVHDLRHTFATMTLKSGKCDLYALRKILGHQSHTTTARYLHYTDEDTRTGLGVMSAVMHDLTKRDLNQT